MIAFADDAVTRSSLRRLDVDLVGVRARDRVGADQQAARLAGRADRLERVDEAGARLVADEEHPLDRRVLVERGDDRGGVERAVVRRLEDGVIDPFWPAPDRRRARRRSRCCR